MFGKKEARKNISSTYKHDAHKRMTMKRIGEE